MTEFRRALVRRTLVSLFLLLSLGIGISAHADPRMYTSELIIHAFGNDIRTSYGSPSPVYAAYPRNGRCNTEPFHPRETLSFYFTPTYLHPLPGDA
jgi:hypothetical protein